MDFDHGDELLDWDMQTDENFDDVLNNGQQNLRGITRQNAGKILDQQGVATSPENWVKFEQDYNQRLYAHAAERRSGDGDSITSLDQGRTRSNEERDTLEGKEEQRNSFSKFSPKHGDSEGARFTVLNEEDADFGGFETSPMEFRGTLTARNSPYASKDSSCCKAIRYSIVALLALAIGMVIGFFMGHSSTAELATVNVTPTTYPKIYTTRAFVSSKSIRPAAQNNLNTIGISAPTLGAVTSKPIASLIITNTTGGLRSNKKLSPLSSASKPNLR